MYCIVICIVNCIALYCLLDLKVTEIAKIIGDEWNNLDQNQKSVSFNKKCF